MVSPSTKPWSPRAISASKARMGAASRLTSDMVASGQRAVGQGPQGKRWAVIIGTPRTSNAARADIAFENEVGCDVTMGFPFELRDVSHSRLHEMGMGRSPQPIRAPRKVVCVRFLWAEVPDLCEAELLHARGEGRRLKHSHERLPP